MISVKRINVSFISAILSLSCAYSQSNTLPNEVIAYIHKRIDAEMNPGIVVGIIDKNGPRYFSFGNTKKGGKKVNEHTIYEIGSISKVFTSTLLADNIIKGKMDTDDPIDRYLPPNVKSPQYKGRPITLGHLADHTSGLPREPDNMPFSDPQNPFADYDTQLMYDFISNHTLRRASGEQYEYSNLAVGLLGNILADHADKSYEELMLEIIARPLQMHETRVMMSKEMKKNLATGHFENTPVHNWDLGAFEGAGAIKSSVHDLLIFLAANLQLFDHPLRQAMMLTHMPRHDKAGDFRVGLGWHIASGKKGDILWHNGGTGGYSAFAGFVKETGTGVVVLTNSTESIDDIGLHILDPDHKLSPVMPHIAVKLKAFIEKEGVEDLAMQYDKFKTELEGKSDFSESGINALGYYYLRRKQFDEAKAVFLLNVREFPQSANVYDSYAEAMMECGNKDQAITYYKKSLEINPGNTNAIEMLSKLGEEVKIDLPMLSDSILTAYVGTYQLAPQFQIVISKEDKQLFAQATNQDKFPIFPKNENEFYYKVVDAQIVFKKDKEGNVISFTLFQNGMEIIGRKVN